MQVDSGPMMHREDIQVLLSLSVRDDMMFIQSPWVGRTIILRHDSVTEIGAEVPRPS